MQGLGRLYDRGQPGVRGPEVPPPEVFPRILGIAVVPEHAQRFLDRPSSPGLEVQPAYRLELRPPPLGHVLQVG